MPGRNNMASARQSNSTRPARSLTESNLHLLAEQKHCDVTFLVGPMRERILCHQLFLKARSPVFEAMFSDRWNEGSKEIKIPDIDSMTFAAFLKVSYKDRLVYTIVMSL